MPIFRLDPPFIHLTILFAVSVGVNGVLVVATIVVAVVLTVGLLVCQGERDGVQRDS